MTSSFDLQDPPDRLEQTKWSFINVLSKSIYGHVCLMENKESGERVAVKCSMSSLAKAQQCSEGRRAFENILREAQIHEHVQRFAREARLPGAGYIVPYLHSCERSKYMYTMTSFCEGGDMFEHVKLHGRVPVWQARKWFKQIALGLQAIHAAGACHMDLSLENIYLDSELNALIGDFGLAQKVFGNGQVWAFPGHSKPGKPNYLAPEVVYSRKSFNGQRADLWSLGIILFVLLTGKFPYDRPSDKDTRFTLVYGGYLHLLLRNWGFSVIKDTHKQQSTAHNYSFSACDQSSGDDLADPIVQLPSTAYSLLEKLLQPEKSRISLAQVLSHPWVNGGNSTEAGSAQVEHSATCENPKSDNGSLRSACSFSRKFSALSSSSSLTMCASSSSRSSSCSTELDCSFSRSQSMSSLSSWTRKSFTPDKISHNSLQKQQQQQQ